MQVPTYIVNYWLIKNVNMEIYFGSSQNVFAHYNKYTLEYKLFSIAYS